MKRWAITVLGAAIGALTLGAVAWACVPVATLNVSPGQVAPGQQVTVTGGSYNNAKPVVLHWGALDGPVLAQATPDGGRINTTFTVPADVKTGNYLVVATQETVAGSTTWGVPARALLSVTGSSAPVLGAPLAAPTPERPVGFVTEDSVSGGALLLAALGAAGVALFVAGMAALLVSRRPREAGPAPVKK